MPEEKNSENLNPEEKPTVPSGPVSFPWGMLCLAALFDLIGIVPVLNLITETLAGLIFGWWQKSYAPKTDPVLTFIVTKIMDVVSLGILPSNIGLVVYAYFKKKGTTKLPSKSLAFNKA